MRQPKITVRPIIKLHRRNTMTSRKVEPFPHVNLRDTTDPVALVESREQMTRELFVAWENINLVREELQTCYKTYGINHFVMCKEIRKEYATLIKDPYFGAVRVSNVIFLDDETNDSNERTPWCSHHPHHKQETSFSHARNDFNFQYYRIQLATSINISISQRRLLFFDFALAINVAAMSSP